MATLVVSDLHLGGRTGVDLLRDPGPLAALTATAREAERLVLLGDVLELRHGPAHEALRAAAGPLRALGEALAGREVLVVPGNHDHALVAGWIRRRGREPDRAPLEVEHRIAPAEASWAAGEVARLLAGAGARCALAYPGVWLRDDVYATHGHYLDLHTTVPSFERIAAGVTTAVSGPLPPGLAGPDHYEARLAPVYAWLDQVAEWAPEGRPAGGAGSAVRVWRGLARTRRGRLAGAAAFPLALAALNRAGIGPLSPDLSGRGLRRGALRAMHEVAGRLGLAGAHVVFGHSHRAGPLPGDDPAEWGSLVNCGSWVLERYGRDRDSPYAPGGAVWVAGSGPPRLERYACTASRPARLAA